MSLFPCFAFGVACLLRVATLYSDLRDKNVFVGRVKYTQLICLHSYWSRSSLPELGFHDQVITARIPEIFNARCRSSPSVLDLSTTFTHSFK